MKECPSDPVGHGSIWVGRGEGAREVVIVDHTSLLDELWSGMASPRSFLRASRRVVAIVRALAIGTRHGWKVWIVCCGVGSEECGMGFWPLPRPRYPCLLHGHVCAFMIPWHRVAVLAMHPVFRFLRCVVNTAFR